MKKASDYDRNVFINCPFDDAYTEILNAILFTVHKCGFILRCAKEFEDSHSIRIHNIITLIKESKYGIHDLSRVAVDDLNKLPRFNMPLELGIFIGCAEFGMKQHKKKQYLIIESEDFRFKRFVSDLSGQDIKAHNDDPAEAVKCIRNWLANKAQEKIPSHSVIWKQYLEFKENLPALCAENAWIPAELTFGEYSSLVTTWLVMSSVEKDA